MNQPMTEQPHVIRWVITHIGKEGYRVLAQAQQGRNTYPDEESAVKGIADIYSNNSLATVREHFGEPLLAKPCRCYPGHFDPMQYCGFDDEDG